MLLIAGTAFDYYLIDLRERQKETGTCNMYGNNNNNITEKSLKLDMTVAEMKIQNGRNTSPPIFFNYY